jgi:hypothetical protein
MPVKKRKRFKEELSFDIDIVKGFVPIATNLRP